MILLLALVTLDADDIHTESVKKYRASVAKAMHMGLPKGEFTPDQFGKLSTPDIVYRCILEMMRIANREDFSDEIKMALNYLNLSCNAKKGIEDCVQKEIDSFGIEYLESKYSEPELSSIAIDDIFEFDEECPQDYNDQEEGGCDLNILKIISADITKLNNVDAIVNPTNDSLAGLKLSGIDKAIHDAAGPELKKECKKIGNCKTGEAIITGAYNLNCKYIIHTVGPKWKGGTKHEKEKLQSCYNKIMELAIKYNVRSIAIPGISTGNFGYPLIDAADVAVETTKAFINNHPGKFDDIYFVLQGENIKLYRDAFKRHGL